MEEKLPPQEKQDSHLDVAKDNKKGFSIVEILIVIVFIGLISAVGWFVYDRQNSKTNQEQANTTQNQTESQKTEPPKPKTLLKGTFGDSGEYGTLQVEGYATTVKRNEDFCQENCKQYDYVFFNITRTENTNIFTYLKNQSGNSFVQDKSVGMGCIINEQVSYSNNSDTRGSQEYTVSKGDTSAVMAATANKPIVLELERLKLSGEGGAPTCYSHFTTFKVIK